MDFKAITERVTTTLRAHCIHKQSIFRTEVEGDDLVIVTGRVHAGFKDHSTERKLNIHFNSKASAEQAQQYLSMGGTADIIGVFEESLKRVVRHDDRDLPRHPVPGKHPNSFDVC